MFNIPRPPKKLGLQTAVQLTLHFLTVTFSLLAKNKPQMIRWIAWRGSTVSSRAVRGMMVWEVSTELTSAFLPVMLKYLPFHGASRFVDLSSRYRKWDLFSLLTVRESQVIS
jgi:hypothetical protein